jgi:hypothetical protein
MCYYYLVNKVLPISDNINFFGTVSFVESQKFLWQ